MSATTVSQSFGDIDLRNRMSATIAKQVWANAQFGDSAAGQDVKARGPFVILDYLMWPTCIANEAAYESAVIAENPRPGYDPAVITDADLTSAVQANWPPVWPLPTSIPPL